MLNKLCSAYWYPLYAFVRRQGHDADTACDLAQEFFLRLLVRRDLAEVDRAKGRFRTFLMVACKHFLANQADYNRAKRGGGRPPIPIDRLAAEGRYTSEPAHGMTAERLFERRWATTLLENVLQQVGAEMSRTGKLTPVRTSVADAPGQARTGPLRPARRSAGRFRGGRTQRRVPPPPPLPRACARGGRAHR